VEPEVLALLVDSVFRDGVASLLDISKFPDPSAAVLFCGYDFVVCVGSASWNGSAWMRWTGTPSPATGGAAWVDFSAPGVAIEGATANTTVSYKFGTGASYATPLVSGVMALLHANGQLTPQAKLNALAAASCPDGWTGNGFVKAGDALWGTRTCP
jgi:subtilisin family serine protease